MTRLELRRLALRTTRNPEWLPVLQDALLEHYGKEFEHAIALAQQRASLIGLADWYAVVIYDPAGLTPFQVYRLPPYDLVRTRSGSWIRHLAQQGRVPVYILKTQEAP